VTGILRANARDDISAHAIIDAFIATATKAKRAIELATPSTAGMTCH